MLDTNGLNVDVDSKLFISVGFRSSSSSSSSSSKSSSSESSSSSSKSSSSESSSSSSSSLSSSSSSSSYSICPFGTDDDFTAPSGSQPDSQKWDIMVNDGGAFILNNAVYYNNGPGSGGGPGEYLERSRYRHRVEFCPNTDFEIQIEFNITTMTGVSNVEGPTCRLGYYRMEDFPSGLSNFVEIRNSNTGRIYYARSDTEAPVANNFIPTLTSTGKLKLKFEKQNPTLPPKALMTVWYDEGSGFEWNGASGGLAFQTEKTVDDGARAYFEMAIVNTGFLEASMDNFQFDFLECVSCGSSSSSSSTSSA